MTGHHGRLRRQWRQHRGLLPHRPVLGGERPQDHAVRSGGREETAAGAPRYRAHARGIAGHPHVARIRKPPAMQRGLVHRRHQEAVVGAEGDAEMRALPFEDFGLRAHVGKPQRHAVVMRDHKPHALGREGKPADSGRRVERLLLALCRAHERGLAGGPRHRAVGMKRDVGDPASLGVGRQRLDLAAGIDRHQLAVITAGHDALAVRRRTENPAAVDGDGGWRALRGHKGDMLLGTDEHRRIAEEMHRRGRRIKRNARYAVGERNDGGLIQRHAVTRCSARSRRGSPLPAIRGR